MKPRASARAILAVTILWGLSQHGCLFFCGKSKLTFQNRCVKNLRHDVYVEDVLVAVVSPNKDFSYDVNAGEYTVAQRHEASATPMTDSSGLTSTLCADSVLIVPRCSEVIHYCNQ